MWRGMAAGRGFISNQYQTDVREQDIADIRRGLLV